MDRKKVAWKMRSRFQWKETIKGISRRETKSRGGTNNISECVCTCGGMFEFF